jgi:hypothetical protein
MKGYIRCSKCNSLVPEVTLHSVIDRTNNNKSIRVCETCYDPRCFECGSFKTKFYPRMKLGGPKFLCRWCSKIYGVVISE